MKNVIKIYNKDSYQVIYNWTGCIPDLKLGKWSFVIVILSMTRILELQIQESNLKESLKRVEVEITLLQPLLSLLPQAVAYCSRFGRGLWATYTEENGRAPDLALFPRLFFSLIGIPSLSLLPQAVAYCSRFGCGLWATYTDGNGRAPGFVWVAVNAKLC